MSHHGSLLASSARATQTILRASFIQLDEARAIVGVGAVGFMSYDALNFIPQTELLRPYWT